MISRAQAYILESAIINKLISIKIMQMNIFVANLKGMYVYVYVNKCVYLYFYIHHSLVSRQFKNTIFEIIIITVSSDNDNNLNEKIINDHHNFLSILTRYFLDYSCMFYAIWVFCF
jgi:hypothetical protein